MTRWALADGTGRDNERATGDFISWSVSSELDCEDFDGNGLWKRQEREKKDRKGG